MWHFVDYSEQHCHEEFTRLYTNATQIRARVPSEGGARPWSWFQDVAPDVLHAIRHAPICLSLFSTRLQGTISLHSFYPLLRRWIPATIIPRALKWHRNAKLTDTLTSTYILLFSPFSCRRTALHHVFLLHPSSFLGNVQQFQIRLSHQFLPVKGKKSGKKSNENDDFSLLKSGPVVCNLLRHSTSSASLFNNFVHRGHKKACRPVRMWWQVPIQTLNINGGERVRPRCADNHYPLHLKAHCH